MSMVTFRTVTFTMATVVMMAQPVTAKMIAMMFRGVSN